MTCCSFFRRVTFTFELEQQLFNKSQQVNTTFHVFIACYSHCVIIGEQFSRCGMLKYNRALYRKSYLHNQKENYITKICKQVNHNSKGINNYKSWAYMNAKSTGRFFKLFRRVRDWRLVNCRCFCWNTKLSMIVLDYLYIQDILKYLRLS